MRSQNEELYEEMIKLYNSGITDKKEIAQITKSGKSTVYSYLKRAEKEEKIKIPKGKFEEFIELYNSGIIETKELCERLQVGEETINNYITSAVKSGKINRIQRKGSYEKLIELYNSGKIDPQELAILLDLKIKTIYVYIDRAEKEGKIIKVQQQRSSRTPLQRKIEEMLKQKYPYEISQELNMPTKEIYDYISSLKKYDKETLERDIIESNYIGKQILKIRRKLGSNIGVTDIIEKLLPTLGEYEEKQLIRFYYLLGQENQAIKTANQLIYSEDTSSAIKKASKSELEKINCEHLVRDIIAHSGVTYSELCRNYKVSNLFVMQVLGREKIPDSQGR